DLEALKFASTSTLRLRKGTATRAERRIDVGATELENFTEAHIEDGLALTADEEPEKRILSCWLTPLFKSGLVPNIQKEF
ncbi:hypothetical protein CU098_004697, partial [Rhizopus stolonifer]